MGKKVEKYNKRGVRTSYISTVIGISLVLFMMGLVIGGVLGLDTIQRNAKESLQVDVFFRPNISVTTIKGIEQELKTWDKFKEVFYVSPEGAIEEFSGGGEGAKEILSIFEGDSIVFICFVPKHDDVGYYNFPFEVDCATIYN